MQLELRNALAELIGAVEVQIPERNCSCHLAPPCEDCVEFGYIREVVGDAKAALSKHDKFVALFGDEGRA